MKSVMILTLLLETLLVLGVSGQNTLNFRNFSNDVTFNSNGTVDDGDEVITLAIDSEGLLAIPAENET
jgi:hypothetical protein